MEFPNTRSLWVLLDLYHRCSLEGIPFDIPMVVPTPEGNTRLEWATGSKLLSVEIQDEGPMLLRLEVGDELSDDDSILDAVKYFFT